MRRLATTCLGALLSVVTMAGCSGGDQPSADSTPERSTSPVLAEYDVGGAGWAMASTPEHLWIQVDEPVDAVVRVEKATGTIGPHVARGWSAASGADGLWVVCCDWLVKVDPASGKELLRVPHGGSIDVGAGGVWVFTPSGALLRVDPASGTSSRVLRTAPDTCLEPKRLKVAFGYAWQACREGVVLRMPLRGGKVRAIPTAMGSHTFAVTEDALWVTNYQAGSVTRIDPRTARTTTIEGTGEGVGITSGGGFVWASDSDGISRIDPATNTVEGHIDLGSGAYYDLVWDDGVIWASTETERLLKIRVPTG